MDAWAACCATPKTGNVVAFRAVTVTMSDCTEAIEKAKDWVASFDFVAEDAQFQFSLDGSSATTPFQRSHSANTEARQNQSPNYVFFYAQAPARSACGLIFRTGGTM
jgi:hypothetical protein